MRKKMYLDEGSGFFDVTIRHWTRACLGAGQWSPPAVDDGPPATLAAPMLAAHPALTGALYRFFVLTSYHYGDPQACCREPGGRKVAGWRPKPKSHERRSSLTHTPRATFSACAEDAAMR